MSHSQDWVSSVEDIQQLVTSSTQGRRFQLLDTARIYRPLAEAQLAKIQVHNLGSVDDAISLCGSDDNDNDDRDSILDALDI